MKVYAIIYYVEEGEAGITAIFKNKADARKRFKLIVEQTFEGDDDVEPATIREAVKKALKTGRHDYSGSGCRDNPWYELSEETIE